MCFKSDVDVKKVKIKTLSKRITQDTKQWDILKENYGKEKIGLSSFPHGSKIHFSYFGDFIWNFKNLVYCKFFLFVPTDIFEIGKAFEKWYKKINDISKHFW